MADIELVIKIPEDVHTRLFDNGIQDNEITVDDVCEMARALRLGTKLERKPKTGHWIPKTQYVAICSVCNHLQSTNGADLTGKALVHKALFKYCPNCGAKMEG